MVLIQQAMTGISNASGLAQSKFKVEIGHLISREKSRMEKNLGPLRYRKSWEEKELC